MNIRKAKMEEAAELSGLAMKSKAYWGYDEAFIEACRPELTLSPAAICEDVTYVLEGEAGILGFYRLSITGQTGVLHDLFLEPGIIGHKWGRMMWNHLIARAKEQGVLTFTLDADPHAEGFYRKMGCQKIGETPSTVFSGRFLPLMRMNLELSE